ncbi:MAG: hypothetical protein CMK59_12450 [Proteobacteria bacterium]|nr:hypothetical protein [Pseudomonadota bacterium]
MGTFSFVLFLSPLLAQDISAEDIKSTEDTNVDVEEDSAEAETVSALIHVNIVLKNGLTLIGTVEQKKLLLWSQGASIDFTPEGGEETTLTGEQIVSIVQSAYVQDGKPLPAQEKPKSTYTSPAGYEFPNPAASRYLYVPSAIPLQKNQGYVSQKYGLFSSVAYAATDNLSLLFGTLTFFPPAMTIFGAKYGVKIKDNLHVSFGGETFIFPMSTMVLASIGFGAVTFGDADNNFTIASGIAGGGEFISEPSIPFMFAGQKRIAPSVSLVTENWVLMEPANVSSPALPDTAGVFYQSWVANIHSGTVRIIGRRNEKPIRRGGLMTAEGYPRTTWDLGLLMMIFPYYQASSMDVDLIGPLPWLDWTWHFGPSGY